MEKMQSKLFEAATQNSITSLHQLLKDDPLILDRSFVNRFNETPLHVAAMLGHVDFVKEIIALKPQLACEVNLQKHTPLHLAAAKGHVEVVTALLSVDDRVTCLARDTNGLTPVHLAAIKGRDGAVKLLLDAQPDAATMCVYEDEETILHLCVKSYQLEALKLILAAVNEAEFVNSKNAHGNTVLHLAVADKQVETIKFLVSTGAVEVNAVNNEGITAMEVLIRSRRDFRDSEIENSLQNAGGFGDLEKDMNQSSSRIKIWRKSLKKQPYADWVDGKKSSLMVVASLIATMAFQIGVNPPGGVWQDEVDSKGKQVMKEHQAGSSVFVDKYPQDFILFYIINTTAFVASLSIILLLTSGLPIRSRIFMWILMVITWIAILATAVSYAFSIYIVTPTYYDYKVTVVLKHTMFLWCGLIGLMLVTHIIRIVKLVKRLRKARMGMSRSSTGASTGMAGP